MMDTKLINSLYDVGNEEVKRMLKDKFPEAFEFEYEPRFFSQEGMKYLNKILGDGRKVPFFSYETMGNIGTDGRAKAIDKLLADTYLGKK